MDLIHIAKIPLEPAKHHDALAAVSTHCLYLVDGSRGPSWYTIRAGDTDAVLAVIDKAKARYRMHGPVRVRSCYEAGRDSLWLHRWLASRHIDNLVVDPASIVVNRRARRAKTDRLAIATSSSPC